MNQQGWVQMLTAHQTSSTNKREKPPQGEYAIVCSKCRQKTSFDFRGNEMESLPKDLSRIPVIRVHCLLAGACLVHIDRWIPGAH